MKIIITGSSGMLGSALVNEFKNSGMHQTFSFDKNQLDITNKKEIEKCFKKIKPNVLINAAAYTDVDDCEINRKQALNVNAKAVKNLAVLCNKINAVLVHFSTDYVFDGKNKNGYKESDKKNPINYYGWSKSLGEDYITSAMENYFIVRTSWLFGNNGKNFVDAILKKSNEREIKVVDEQRGCPTYTNDLAIAVRILLQNHQNYGFGIYHITNEGDCTWFDFAKEIIKINKSKSKVVPIKSSELDRKAKRPKCSVLINTKFKNKLPIWQDALRRYLGGLR